MVPGLSSNSPFKWVLDKQSKKNIVKVTLAPVQSMPLIEIKFCAKTIKLDLVVAIEL